MNTNKKVIISFLVVLVLLAVGFYFASKKEVLAPQPLATDMPVPLNTGEAPNTVEEMVVGDTTYTLVEVSTHNTPTDCWTTINGGVYDLGAWVKKHPGGEANILKLCGIDGSVLFNGKHGGVELQLSILAGFKIGSLKQ